MKITTVGIKKRFGDVIALRGVDFQSNSGEIHGLLGENGAGKTTLMNIVYGLYKPDEGEIFLNGKPISIRSPADAIKIGIGMVHQQSTLVDKFNAFENIILGSSNSSFNETQATIEKIKDLSKAYGLVFPLFTEVGLLEIGMRQKIEIIRAIFRGANTLILDEPTTTLTEAEFDLLKISLISLAKDGISIILITHKIREVFGICDQVTILRNGLLQGSISIKDVTEEQCIKLMFSDLEIDINSAALPVVEVSSVKLSDTPKLQISNLISKGDKYNAGIDDISFDVYGGEIFGIAGITGNGQKELVDAIFNPSTWANGDIKIDGKSVKGLRTVEIINLGVSYTPEDRIREGILPNQSIINNVLLHLYHKKDYRKKKVLIDWDSINEATNWIMREFNVAAKGAKTEIQQLSGGNIQKVVLGRALINEAKVLVTHNPTCGLDVSTVNFIFKQLLKIRGDGGAILFVNEDLDELMVLCDRIAVINNGRIVSILNRDKFNKYKIGELMVNRI